MDGRGATGAASRTPSATSSAAAGPAPRLIIGSHLDSVADAGRYDGILGVLVGLEVAAATDIPLEVVAFADEEGLRFQSTFLGSRAYVGAITPEEEAMVGIELGEPLFDGASGYLEVHIEQGPVLVAEGVPLGVVTAIFGQSRFTSRSPARPRTRGRRR